MEELPYIQQADVLIEDNFGYHCLHQSAQTGCLDSVQYLVEECYVDVNSLSSLGFSALAVAAKEGQTNILLYLLNHGCNVDLMDTKGRTALHIASGAQHGECVKVLLQHGAKIIPDMNGNTPIQLARRPEVQALFMEHS